MEREERQEENGLTTADALVRADFAGSAACANCHQEIAASHLHTAHALTSDTASLKNILGSFKKGENEFEFANGVKVAMERRGDSLYQVAYKFDAERVSRTIDVVVGSGAKGQTYLNYRNHSLFQLPISYLTVAGSWSNSPGYPFRVVYDRMITSRCMECHSTFARHVASPVGEPEQFDLKQIVYGISCERCHGPGASHVAFQSAHPGDTTAKYILNPARFSRQQQMDLCSLCHGGRLEKSKPSFSFVAGDKLSDFFRLDTTVPDPRQIDVHGNQAGLLKSSACYRMSNTMTCSTCHDAHQRQRNQPAAFSQKCMSCHAPESSHFCPKEKQLGAMIRKDCINCHMPVSMSAAIAMYLPSQNSPTAARVRSHRIAVYPEQ